MKRYAISIFILMISLLSRCTLTMSGNSSETTNGIMVIARSGAVNGIAPSFSSVYLFKSSYDPLCGMPYDSIATDTTGVFHFRIQEKNYNLFCHGIDGLRSLTKIMIDTNAVTDDTIYDTLLPPGRLQGYAFLKDSGSVSFLYLMGSPFFSRADSSGFFQLDSIPQGQYTFRLFTTSFYGDKTVSSPLDTIGVEETSIINIASDSLLIVKFDN